MGFNRDIDEQTQVPKTKNLQPHQNSLDWTSLHYSLRANTLAGMLLARSDSVAIAAM